MNNNYVKMHIGIHRFQEIRSVHVVPKICLQLQEFLFYKFLQPPGHIPLHHVQIPAENAPSRYEKMVGNHSGIGTRNSEVDDNKVQAIVIGRI